GDLAEARAIRRLFRGERPRVNAAKSMLGHALAAGSALEAVACVLSLRDGILHPNPTLETPDPEIDLDLVGREAVREPVRFVLSNAFGFGGHNSSLLFARV
ncbi:MAG: beta-ketoacyl-[acyl-carrier-protein] synthase II, partial [Fibrobacterales bacterium]|nr:beta-ketoacyl-[acyl-carrier-protein] synthase II [Fibrobacterales bacterium]